MNTNFYSFSNDIINNYTDNIIAESFINDLKKQMKSKSIDGMKSKIEKMKDIAQKKIEKEKGIDAKDIIKRSKIIAKQIYKLFEKYRNSIKTISNNTIGKLFQTIYTKIEIEFFSKKGISGKRQAQIIYYIISFIIGASVLMFVPFSAHIAIIDWSMYMIASALLIYNQIKIDRLEEELSKRK